MSDLLVLHKLGQEGHENVIKYMCSHDNEVQSVSQNAANNNIISLTSERVDK